MSVQALSWVLDNSESEHAARLVLISIANHCDKIGQNAWPSVQAIGSEARLCERIVRSAISELETLGELTVQRGAGPHRTNLYSLPKILGAKNAPAENAGAEFPERVQSLPVEGAKSCSAIRNSRPEPSLEPSGVQHPLNHAYRIIQVLSLPSTFSLKETIAAAVVAEADFQGITNHEAAEYICRWCMGARHLGADINKFTFQDTKWRNTNAGPKSKPSAAIARSERLQDSITAGISADLSRRTETHSVERENRPRRVLGN